MEMETKSEVMQDINTVRFMRRYSKADIVSFIITIASLVASAYIPNPYAKGICIAVAALSLIAPAITMRIIERNSFSLSYVHKVLSEAGLNPVNPQNIEYMKARVIMITALTVAAFAIFLGIRIGRRTDINQKKDDAMAQTDTAKIAQRVLNLIILDESGSMHCIFS